MTTDTKVFTVQKYSRPAIQDEAILITQGNFLQVAKWCKGQAKTSGRVLLKSFGEPLEAWPGDWLVRVPTGEFYVMSETEFWSCHQHV